jgi:hypothetical protein
MLDNESAIQKFKRDTFFLKEATLTDNDILSIIVSYSGGCKKHDFILATVSSFIRTDSSDQVNLVLAHENNGDICKKIVKEHLYFDLLPLKERYQQVYGIKASSIVLRLLNASISYKFK